jgi:hypothetical protein
MGNLISSAMVLVSEKSRMVSWHCRGSFNSDLFLKLKEYHSIIGVMGYKEYDNYIEWFFNNRWYPSEQIERVVKLPMFA